MNYTIEKLISGDEKIIGYYRKAREHWEEMINDTSIKSSAQFANSLSSQQLWFEKNCGGRWLGQEIMAVVGLMQFYSNENGFNGNERSAIAIYEAFTNSYCSLEVKSIVDNIAEKYYINELYSKRYIKIADPFEKIETFMQIISEKDDFIDKDGVEGESNG